MTNYPNNSEIISLFLIVFITLSFFCLKTQDPSLNSGKNIITISWAKSRILFSNFISFSVFSIYFLVNYLKMIIIKTMCSKMFKIHKYLNRVFSFNFVFSSEGRNNTNFTNHSWLTDFIISSNNFYFVSYFHILVAKFVNSRSFQHLLDRPFPLYAVFKKSTLKSFFSRPLSKWFGFSFISKQVIIRTVKVLLPKTNPSTILFTVMSVRIYTVNTYSNFTRFLIRFIHILFKFLKRLPQNLYSSTSVIFKAIMFRIFTPLLHSTPNIIKSCSAHIMFHIQSIANYKFNVKQLCTH